MLQCMLIMFKPRWHTFWMSYVRSGWFMYVVLCSSGFGLLLTSLLRTLPHLLLTLGLLTCIIYYTMCITPVDSLVLQFRAIQHVSLEVKRFSYRQNILFIIKIYRNLMLITHDLTVLYHLPQIFPTTIYPC